MKERVFCLILCVGMFLGSITTVYADESIIVSEEAEISEIMDSDSLEGVGSAVDTLISDDEFLQEDEYAEEPMFNDPIIEDGTYVDEALVLEETESEVIETGQFEEVFEEFGTEEADTLVGIDEQAKIRYDVAIRKTEGGIIRFSDRMILPEKGYIGDESIADLRSFAPNTEMILEVIPEDGFALQNLSVESINIPELYYAAQMYGSECVFVMPEDSVVISAVFVENILDESEYDSGRTMYETAKRTGIIPVTGIALDQTNLELTVGDTADLMAIISPEDATNKDVIWSSNDESVAVVADGLVTAVGNGTTILTVTADGGFTENCTVTVKAGYSGSCGENLTWILEDGILVISGSGDMYDFVDDDFYNIKAVPWRECYGLIKKVVVENGVTSIGTGAFNPDYNNNQDTALEEVIIADSVARIGHSAFAWCRKLKEIKLPKQMTIIYKNTFYGCSSLATIMIPENVICIQDGAFFSCYRLETVRILNGDTQIEIDGYFGSVFSGSENITIYSIPGSIVEQYALDQGFRFKPVEEYSGTGGEPRILVAGVSLNQASLEITVNETVQLTATVLPEDASNQGVTWSSSDESVAIVDTQGRIVPLSEGTTVITVTTEDGGYTASCTVNVNLQEEGIAINEENFPDDTIRAWLQRNYGTVLSQAEIDNTETISIRFYPEDYSEINLSGLQYFTELRALTVQGYEGSTSINLGTCSFSKLESLVLSEGHVVGDMDLTGCPALKEIYIGISESGYGSIKNLNLSNLKALEKVIIGNYTRIQGGVNLSGCTALKKINISGGSSLMLDGCTALNEVFLGSEYENTFVYLATTEDHIDLSGIDPWVDAARISDLEGATLTGTMLSNYNCPGSTRISYRYDCGEGYTKTVYLYVDVASAPVSVNGISLEAETYDLTPDDHIKLRYTISPEDASNQGVTWSSSDESVAIVDTQGGIVPLSEGTAVITVTTEDGGYTASCTVKVGAQEDITQVTGISLSQTSLDIEAGNTSELVATVFPKDASNQEVSWSSSDESVAIVDTQGRITAQSEGTAIITATTEDGSYTASCTVFVRSHIWNETYTVDKEATCMEEGSESIHCSVCGIIDESTVRTIPKKDHTYGDWAVTKDATCTESGNREKSCVYCGIRVTEDITATGHIWNEEYTVDREPTYTEEGSESIHCSVCDVIKEGSRRAIEKLFKTGWVKDDIGWKYYKEDRTLAKGWLSVESEWYYLKSNGYMAVNEWAKDSKGWCWMSADGKITKNKWIKSEDEWYYLKSNGYMAANEWARDSKGWCWMSAGGEIIKNMWIKSGEEWYYLKSNGYMAANEWARDRKGWCWMDANGKIVKNKWIKSGGEWYYLKSNGYKAENEWTKDSKGWCWMDGDGKITKDKWHESDGEWYYLKSNGYMAANEWISDGSGEWYYLKSSGKRACNEWLKIEGKWYYFSGNLMVTGERYIDGTYYYFNNNGTMYTGWYHYLTEYDDCWYYYKSNGKRAYDEWLQLEGKWYYFSDSRMDTGEQYIDGSRYRFNNNGTMYTGWYHHVTDHYDYWYYYKSNGKEACDEWLKIGEKWYYFSDYYMVSDCIRVINGKGYEFAKNGAMMHENDPGWKYRLDANGNVSEKYYVNKGGSLATGWQKIDGKWYYFDTYSCYMYGGDYPRTYTIDNKGYLFGTGGALLGTEGGWIILYNDWGYVTTKCYANKGGSLVSRWQNIDGKQYYFDAYSYNAYYNGTYTIDQKQYTFDKNGVCTG